MTIRPLTPQSPPAVAAPTRPAAGPDQVLGDQVVLSRGGEGRALEDLTRATARVGIHAGLGALSTLAGPLAGMGIGALVFGVVGAVEGMMRGAGEMARHANNEATIGAGLLFGGMFGLGAGAIVGVAKGLLVGGVGGLFGPAGGAVLSGSMTALGEWMRARGDREE